MLSSYANLGTAREQQNQNATTNTMAKYGTAVAYPYSGLSLLSPLQSGYNSLLGLQTSNQNAKNAQSAAGYGALISGLTGAAGKWLGAGAPGLSTATDWLKSGYNYLTGLSSAPLASNPAYTVPDFSSAYEYSGW
jgi:hypothetical protein